LDARAVFGALQGLECLAEFPPLLVGIDGTFGEFCVVTVVFTRTPLRSLQLVQMLHLRPRLGASDTGVVQGVTPESPARRRLLLIRKIKYSV
jgi:hypothetical protein